MVSALVPAAPVETVTILGIRFPIVARDEDGTVWAIAVDAAKAVGMEPRDGAQASQHVPAEMKGTFLKGTPGGVQSMVTVNQAGMLVMAINARGKHGQDARKELLGFTLRAAASALAPAAPSLSVEDVRRIAREEVTAHLPIKRQLSMLTPETSNILAETAVIKAKVREIEAAAELAKAKAKLAALQSGPAVLTDRLYGVITSAKQCTTTDLHRSTNNRITRVELSAALDALLKAGRIRCEVTTGTLGRRRVTRWYPVEPQ